MIRIILDRTVQMTEDEFKRIYRTLDIENEELENLLTHERASWTVCGAETIAQQRLSGSANATPKSCDNCCHKDEDSPKSPCVHCCHNYFSCHASQDS